MTPQELKNSILQLAIQGKLVEQRPEEGTAEKLYQQIQGEKQKLIKTGKIKKEKPLPEITEDEIPFVIPESWMWVRLRDICTKIVDGDHNPPSGITERTPYWMLSAQNIINNSLSNLDQVRYLSEEVFLQENERTRVQPGDIFFTIVATLGRSCVYEGGYNICFQRSVSVLSTLIYNYYLKYALDSGFIQQHMTVNATGTAQKGFYLNQVEKLLIPLPPLSEQKRIVAKIEEFLPLINRYELAWSRLEELKKGFPGDLQKSILQTAIQGKLVAQCDADSLVDLATLQMKPTEEYEFELPDNWSIGHLESITDAVPSKQYQILESQVLKEGLYTVISQSKEYSIGYSNESGKVFHHIDPVVVFGDHTTEIKYIDFDFVVGADGVKIFAPKPFLLPLFFFYVMKYLCIGLNKKVGYSRHYKYIKDKPIPLPPLDEQKRIVARLEELLPLCERLKRGFYNAT